MEQSTFLRQVTNPTGVKGSAGSEPQKVSLVEALGQREEELFSRSCLERENEEKDAEGTRWSRAAAAASEQRI